MEMKAPPPPGRRTWPISRDFREFVPKSFRWTVFKVTAGCLVAHPTMSCQRPSPVSVTGVPRSRETPPSQDPKVGLHLGSYGGLRGWGVAYVRGNYVSGTPHCVLPATKSRVCHFSSGFTHARVFISDMFSERISPNNFYYTI